MTQSTETTRGEMGKHGVLKCIMRSRHLVSYAHFLIHRIIRFRCPFLHDYIKI